MNFSNLSDDEVPTNYKKLYRKTLDEVSVLLERNRELECRLEEFKKSHPEQIQTLTDRVAELENELDESLQNRSRLTITPLALKVGSENNFEKLVLSLGMYGTIRDEQSLDRLQFKFHCTDMTSSRNDQEDFLSQFLPMIVEDLRSTIVQRFAELKKDSPQPNIADVGATNSDQGGRLRGRRNRTPQEDFGFVTLSCSTNKKKFPTLDHGFHKELLCVILPSTSKTAKTLNVILAIGTAVSSSDFSDESVHYSIKMLAHDYELLVNHERTVNESDVLSRLHWHHLTGLIPSSRMYDACSPKASLLFPEQILYHERVQWPKPVEDGFNFGTSLNSIQGNVVKSLAPAEDRGLFFLIGPPGTGKTTTTTWVLIQRVRHFPEEKILLTAPSNKAIQVVLHKLIETQPDIAVAVIGTGKLSSADHEKYYASGFTSSLIKLFDAVLSDKSTLRARKAHVVAAVDVVVARLVWLLDPERAGLHVPKEDRAAIKDSLSWFRANDCSDVADEDTLKEHVRECKHQLQRIAEDIERFILLKAHIVFGTLVASGRKSLAKIVRNFDTVIVDEASQALLPATFIPFKFSPARYLLVGDPKQLPATVSSDKLKDLGYADSLMLVMQNVFGTADKYAVMLTAQYRMHPSICKPISELFYHGKLVTEQIVRDRPSELKKLPQQMALKGLPSAFIDINSVECKIDGGSISNYDEAVLVVRTVRFLLEHNIKAKQIGIVTGYAAQVSLLKKLLQEMLRGTDLSELATCTVDGFQGDERDFILFSCVRANTTSVGFLKDDRRINVALSRARHACWVFGQRRCLAESNSPISDFLDLAQMSATDAAFTTAVVAADALVASMEAVVRVAPGPSAAWGVSRAREVPVVPVQTAPSVAPVAVHGVVRGPPAAKFDVQSSALSSRAVASLHNGSPTSVASTLAIVTPQSESLVVEPRLPAQRPKPKREIISNTAAIFMRRRK